MFIASPLLYCGKAMADAQSVRNMAHRAARGSGSEYMAAFLRETAAPALMAPALTADGSGAAVSLHVEGAATPVAHATIARNAASRSAYVDEAPATHPVVALESVGLHLVGLLKG